MLLRCLPLRELTKTALVKYRYEADLLALRKYGTRTVYIRRGWAGRRCRRPGSRLPYLQNPSTGLKMTMGDKGELCSTFWRSRWSLSHSITRIRSGMNLMVQRTFMSDERSWCHVFNALETVSSVTFRAAMEHLFTWAEAEGVNFEESLLLMDGAPAHTANASRRSCLTAGMRSGECSCARPPSRPTSQLT